MADCNNCSSYLSSEDIIRRSVKCSGGSLAFIGSNANHPVPNETEVDTYISGLATPLSATEIGLLNTLVSSLKTGLSITNLSDFFDYFNVRAGETAEQSLRNLVKNLNHSTAVNSPTFTAGNGFKGNGTSSYINVDYKPSGGIRYKHNDASYGLYLKYFDRSGTFKYNGTYATTGNGASLNSLNIGSAGATSIRVSINSSSITELSNNKDKGLFIVNRIISTEYSLYVNGIKEVNNNIDAKSYSTSSTPPDQNMIELARMSESGVPGLYNASEISFSFCGKSMTDSHEAVIRNAMEAYMDAKGTGIIA